MNFTLPGGFSVSIFAIAGVIAVVAVAVGYIIWSRSSTPKKVAVEDSEVEGFGSTSPGTMTQLAANHVPTEDDEDAAKAEMQRAQDEADDMTQEHAPV
jgi:hypothetical protein